MLMDTTYFIADKACDSEAIRTRLKQDSISLSPLKEKMLNNQM